MRITIDGRLWGLENAGLGRYLMNLVDGLTADSKNEYTIILRKKYYESLEFPKNWRKVLADFRHYSLAEQIKLPPLLRETKPDIVHFPHFNIPFLYGGPFVVTIHDLLMHRQKGYEATTLSIPMYLVKRLGYRKVFDFAIRRSKAIIVPSISVKNELLDFYDVPEKKISVIYEGISRDLGYKEGFKMKEKYFVYVGNAYPHKNLARLIEAIIILNNKSTQKVKLAIVSSRNVFIERLKLLIKERHAEELVELTGFVPDKNLGYLLQNSLGFIFPSLSEGFGLPGLEAMQAGTIVLASDIPVFKEIYADHAFYFDPLDTSSIAKEMKKVLEMYVLTRRKKIAMGKNFVRKYEWKETALQTINIYNTVS